MKIAVLCDFLVDKGGAEREILIMAKALKADVITTQYSPENTYEEFSSVNVVPNPLASYGKHLLMQSEASAKFRNVDLSKYDTVISMGDWARHVCFNKTLRARHILITISPPRMFYDLKPVIEKSLDPVRRTVFKTWSAFASRKDKQAVSKIKEIYVQSAEAKRRVEGYYKRKVEKEILYPPTEVKKYKSRAAKGYFLSVQRIMPAKRVEIQIDAFNKMPEKKLIVAGSVHPSKKKYFEGLKKRANPNIKFVTNMTNKKLTDLYSGARAVIQTSDNEDFGLVPVESMASGKACIAVNEGGFRETITNKTGILIDKPYVENLVKTVENFDSKKFKKSDLLKRSKVFSDEVFVQKMKRIISP